MTPSETSKSSSYSGYMQYRDIPSYESLLEAQGGFGKFQFIACFFIIAGINCYSWEQYNLPYLLLYPDFDCKIKIDNMWLNMTRGSDDYNKKCIPEYFCKNKDEI